MKKKSKILFAFVMMFVLVGMVSAVADSFSKNGTLENIYDDGTNVYNPVISDTATFGPSFKTYINNIKNVSGQNAKGGIRVFTTAKRKVAFTWWKIGEEQSNVFPSTTATPALLWDDKGVKETKIEWQNRTGNTSFYGTFNAKNS